MPLDNNKPSLESLLPSRFKNVASPQPTSSGQQQPPVDANLLSHMNGDNILQSAMRTTPFLNEVTTTADKQKSDFPEFDAFRQKYSLGSSFGFDKLPGFYDKLQMANQNGSLNDKQYAEVKQDYAKVTSEGQQKLGKQGLYTALGIPNQNIVNDTAVQQDLHLSTISNTMQSLVRGEGAMAFLNPIMGTVVKGLEEGQKGTAQAQDLWNTGYKTASLVTSLNAAATEVFGVMMGTADAGFTGVAFNAGMEGLKALSPTASDFVNEPITKIFNPDHPLTKAISKSLDIATQFGIFALGHALMGMATSPKAKDIIANNAETQIKGMLSQYSRTRANAETELGKAQQGEVGDKGYQAGVNEEVGTRDLSYPQTPENDKFVAEQKLRHADLGNEYNDKRGQLQKLTDALKKTKDKTTRENLRDQIIKLNTNLENINAERDAITEAIRPYGGIINKTAFPDVQIKGLLPQRTSTVTAPEGQGENVPSNINWSKGLTRRMMDSIGVNTYADGRVAPEQATPTARGKETLLPEEQNKVEKFAGIPFRKIGNVLKFENGAKLVFNTDGKVMAGITPDGKMVNMQMDLPTAKKPSTPQEATDEVLQNKKQVLQKSLADVPEEDKPIVQDEINKTNKDIQENKNPSQTSIEGQGSTNENKPSNLSTSQENVQPNVPKEEIPKTNEQPEGKSEIKKAPISNNDSFEKILADGKKLPGDAKKGFHIIANAHNVGNVIDKALEYADREPNGDFAKVKPQLLALKDRLKVAEENAFNEFKNKLIGDEQYNKWKTDFNKLNTDISSNPYEWYAKQTGRILGMGAYHFQQGAIGFAEWSKKMIDDFGDNIKPHLIGIWNDIKSNPSLTQIAKQPDSFNATEQRFFSTESSSKLVGKVAKTLSAFKDWGEGFEQGFQSAFPLMRKYGEDSYAEVMKGIHLADKVRLQYNNASSQNLEHNFGEVEKFFNRFSSDHIELFNLLYGKAVTPEGIELQRQARAKFDELPKDLQNPKLMDGLKDMSDWAHKLATDSGMKLDYVEDYWYGSYKSSKATGDFLKYWQTTDKWTKQKMFPTHADAVAWGNKNHMPMELKNPNPVSNRLEESLAIARRLGMMGIDKWNTETQAPYMVDMDKASAERYKTWQPIHDPVFKGKLFDPLYAKLVNNMIEVNKVSQSVVFSKMRGLSYATQFIKFAGSDFHLVNMLKTAIASENGNILTGVLHFAKAFKTVNEADPNYQNYVGLGAEHRFSLESEAQRMVTNGISKIADYAGIDDKLRQIYGATKFIPLTPEHLKWMFDDFIPTLKYNRYSMDVVDLEQKLGRPLTDGEKIGQIRKIQQRYGEMNERLYGRSASVTSALRVLFLAPGYGEGNFRTALSSLNLWKDVKGDNATNANRDNLKFVVGSLVTSLTMATAGTYLLTGKAPAIPKTARDIRDLWKIKTGTKDKAGDDLYLDVMTYDKDFWAIYGDVLTGQPDKAVGDIGSRISGATSPGLHAVLDMLEVFAGRQLRDYAGHEIFNSADSFPDAMGKFLKYEADQAMPISLTTLGQNVEKGISPTANAFNMFVGARPVYSERVKMIKEIKGETFSLMDNKKAETSKLVKMMSEHPEQVDAEKQKFNDTQTKKLNALSKKAGLPIGDYNKFIIGNVNQREQVPSEQSLQELWDKSPRRRAIRRMR